MINMNERKDLQDKKTFQERKEIQKLNYLKKELDHELPKPKHKSMAPCNKDEI